ncbi:HD domain-containing phosphohydrolase [Petroclostridium sp. X23]|uniref:HD-GYP domain-containing protein n=1 Tax=Petroclostridium sp. X23 TaxID=3045146 RepID=UPI0024ACA65C|nr:HD domain-containing phosphohydrolase [Petroclostridium sp. X23]WHH58803.1 HD domain-containing protein [Petroclostridium sp. X23]
MRSEKTGIISPVMRIIILILCMILAIIFCFAYLFYQSSKYEYQEKVIVNLFGKQRMLTQKMAKDANRLYVLMQALKTGPMVDDEQSLRDKIADTKNNLSLARESFNNTLEAMHDGYIQNGTEIINFKNVIEKSAGYLQNIDSIWINFETAVTHLLEASEINENTAKAIIYINANNEQLLHDSDIITQSVLKYGEKNSERSRNISIVLVGISSAVIIIMLHNLYKYIINPLNEFYRGISGIGLNYLINEKTTPTKKEVKPVIVEINGILGKINKLIALIENINMNSSFSEILTYIYNEFSCFMPYSYIGIALIKENRNVLEASYGISDGSITGLPAQLIGKKYYIKDTSLGKVIDSGNARIINDLEAYVADKPSKDYNKAILGAGIKSSLTLPLKLNGEPVGIIFFSSREKNAYVEEHVKFLKTLANSIAISFEKNVFTEELIYSSVLALVKLAEARDEDTGDHLERMKIYSKTIAQFLYEDSKYSDMINPEYINDIERFSPMHDIGKVGVRDGILLKPGKLDADEFEEMKKHASYGAEVLKAAESSISRKKRRMFQMGVEIAESHHEKWDGSGYPYGKSGKEIPLSARIVAVADVFDALTSKRPYKEPFPFKESFDIIINGSRKHFDPEIVRVFELNRNRIYKLYMKFRNNGRA